MEVVEEMKKELPGKMLLRKELKAIKTYGSAEPGLNTMAFEYHALMALAHMVDLAEPIPVMAIMDCLK